MASNITVVVSGGEPVVYNGVSTVGELKSQIRADSDLDVSSYTAVVNGESASDSHSLNSYSHVALTTATKGGVS
jgi:hypothetical protein